jgi:hypothetical protein
MGNGTSKEEQLYQAVQSSNHNTVKALRRDGASLEVRLWILFQGGSWLYGSDVRVWVIVAEFQGWMQAPCTAQVWISVQLMECRFSL